MVHTVLLFFKFNLLSDNLFQMLERNIDPSIYRELMDTICGGRMILDQNEKKELRVLTNEKRILRVLTNERTVLPGD